jgi:hypothetical protein
LSAGPNVPTFHDREGAALLLGRRTVNGNRVDLSLNSNLGGPSGKDIDLYSMVTGGLSGIDVAVGGLNFTIVEAGMLVRWLLRHPGSALA